jgi:hypothetical protein
MVAEAIDVEDGRQPVGRWHDSEGPTESGTIAGPMETKVMMPASELPTVDARFELSMRGTVMCDIFKVTLANDQYFCFYFLFRHVGWYSTAPTQRPWHGGVMAAARASQQFFGHVSVAW